MNFLQKISGSESPKLERPIRALWGYAAQKTGLSENIQMNCPHYSIPLYAKSNVALTMWVNPNVVHQEEEFVYDFLKPGDILIDVGANIGCVTAAGSLAVGTTGAVFSIEPHPQTFRYLQKTIEINRCQNVKAFNIALGAESGVVNFSDEPRKDDSNCVSFDLATGIRVPCTTLSSLVEEHKIARISLLKIDVEGFEMHVLQGASAILNRVECIYIEVLEHTLQKFGTSTSAVLTLLQSHGFRCYYFQNDRSNVVAVADPARLAEMLTELEYIP